MILPENLLPPPKKSWKQIASKLPQAKQDALLETFRSEEVSALFDDWMLDARREQISPPGKWYIWMILAGRGFGKTYSGAHWIIEMHRQGLASNSAIVAPTSGDLRRFCLEGPSGILSVAPKHFYPRYLPSAQKLDWPNGTTTNLYTSEKPDRLRGPNHDAFWGDEVTYWKYPEQVWNMLMLTMRLGSDPRGVVTMTPRPIKLVKDLLAREGKDVIITRGSTYENLYNLSPQFRDNVVSVYEGTRLGRQELMGEVLMDVEGALWDHALLDETRLELGQPLPVMEKIVVGVDPATTSGPDSEETGIVVAGRDTRKHGYVLGDHTVRGSPEAWARKAVTVYYTAEANEIVAEKNQGGDMVRSVIHNFDPNVPVRLVHASKGKVARAEPISMLYEQRRVHHAETFPQLEDEMCLFVPGEMDGSPNRVDAAVWALTHVMLVNKFGRARAFGRRREAA